MIQIAVYSADLNLQALNWSRGRWYSACRVNFETMRDRNEVLPRVSRRQLVSTKFIFKDTCTDYLRGHGLAHCRGSRRGRRPDRAYQYLICKNLKGLQIGAVNVVGGRFPSSVFFAPIINAGF